MRDWTSDNEWYDAQCREPQGTICSLCGERYREEDITYTDGRAVCCDCLKEYIDEYGRNHAEEFTDDYIAKNIDERAADYWQNEMSEPEKKDLMRMAYVQARRFHKECGMKDIEQSDREFCLESDDYTDFVRDRVCW